MNNDHMIALGRHEGWLRLLSHGVREGDQRSIDVAAKAFDMMLPDECIVVPMPSHEGRSTYMYRVASKLCRNNGRVFKDILCGRPHESNYTLKKEGLHPVDPYMWITELFDPMGMKIFVIDNTIGSGLTAMSALNAMRGHYNDVFVYALTKGSR